MNNDKKILGISTIAVIALIIIAVASTYAFFKATEASDDDTPLQVTTNTTDSLVFNVDTDITMVADMSNFTEGKGNREGVANATATLKANNKTNNATGNYYLYFDIKENGLKYTTEAKTAELILQVSGPDGELGDGDIANLNYVTVTDGKGESVSGFDITEVQDLITIASNKEITTTSEKVDNWEIKVVLVNLNEDQSSNGGKNFNAELLIQKEGIGGTIMQVSHDYTGEIWGYRDKIKKIIVESEIPEHQNISQSFNISSKKKEYVMAYMIDNGDDTFNVYIQSDGKIKANETSDFLFYRFSILESIEGLENIDTSEVRSMKTMFYENTNLKVINGIELWDTSKVIDMRNLFMCCENLQSLDLSNWDVSNVTSFSQMFSECKSLTTLGDLSNWDTSNVESMHSLFSQCGKLQSLNIGTWNTSKVKEMGCMFQSCANLQGTMDLSNWDVSKVGYMHSMFYGCVGLTTINLSNWNFLNVEYLSNMFQKCTNLNTIDLRNADFTSAKYYEDMFKDTTKYLTIYVKNPQANLFIQSRLDDSAARGIISVV